jgi:hypothetical protein
LALTTHQILSVLVCFALAGWCRGQSKDAVRASAFPGADCGAKINAAEASLGSAAGAIEVDNSCGISSWSPVNISHNHHTVRFLSSGPFVVKNISLSGDFDAMIGPAYITQMGGADANTVVLSGNDGRIEKITCDGSAPQPSKGGSVDDCFLISGSRNYIMDNTVVATQGNGISVLGISSSHAGAENVIKNNKIHNATASRYGEGILVGNVGYDKGSLANRNIVDGNLVSNVNGNCIYITGDVGTRQRPSNGTQTNYTQILNNTVSDCGDSPIEASDMVFHSLIQGNIVDCGRNACILSRDGISTTIVGNSVFMEASALQAGIAIGPAVFQSAGFDAHALVANNTIRGYIAHFGISVSQSGAHITGNDIEDTYRSVGDDGSGLGGDGISCGGANVNSCFIQGNRIKHVLVGIDFNYGARPDLSSSDLVATDNWITQVSTGINLFQLRCTNCNFSKNFISQVLSVAIQDNGQNANGTGTSHAVGNTLSLSGWVGAKPRNTVQNLPGYHQ